MSPAQRDEAAFILAEETRPLHARIAELEKDLKEAEEELASNEAWIATLQEAHAGELHLRDLAADMAAADLRTVKARLSDWNGVARALRTLLAQNPTVKFKPGPGPARLILGHYGLQGLGMDELLRALAVVAEECKPCLSKT